jgi:hypothetical protein
VILYDITGRKLLDETFTSTLNISIESLAKGIYLVQLFNGKESVVRKLVKE